MEAGKTIILTPTNVTNETVTAAPTPLKRHSRKQIALAFGVAAVSDVLSWVALMPPFDWLLDGVTALALFLILGRRWALVPGLAAEAIPGMGIFPVWVLVVASILVYDGIKKPVRA